MEDGSIIPTFSSDPEGFNSTMYELKEPSKLIEPPICYDDFMVALTKSKKTVNKDALSKFDEWTNEYG